MNERKSLFHKLAEVYDQHRAERRAASAGEATPQPGGSRLRRIGRWFLPNGGTLLLVALLIVTVNVWARPAAAPAANSVTTIPYQGRLADLNGDPITGRVNMEFCLYDVPVDGTPLWQEYWTGGDAVNVSDGLFSVMLGSLNPTLVDAVQGHDELYLGITVGTDREMEPRVQLGSVPFSVWSLTVADDSITADKIAADAVGSEEIATDAVGSDEIAADAVGAEEIAAGAVGTDEIADGAVTSRQVQLTTGEVRATDNLSLNSSFQDVPGASTTLDVSVNSTVLLMLTCDFEFSEWGTGRCRVFVDGQPIERVGGPVEAYLSTTTSMRAHVSNHYRFDLAAGSHTIQIKADSSHGGTLYSRHTGFTYLITASE